MNSSLGLSSNCVRVDPYCSEWPTLFALEKYRIADLLSDPVPWIEHIGSTAVPGLAAKPILDIMIGAANSAEMAAIATVLEAAGYTAKGEMGIAGRLFFTRGNPCTVHLHLVERAGDIWKSHLKFRDELIANPNLALKYLELKEALAGQFSNDRDAYTLGKAEFIESVINSARNPKL